MVATFAHLLLWLVAGFAAIWTLSSLGIAVLAIAAVCGNRRVIAPDSAAPGDVATASVTGRWAAARAGRHSRLFL
jgi:hypothetical protein